MSKFLTGSICLSDLPKEKITTSERNGKKYLNVVIWINDVEDKFGNIASLQVSQTKEERESKAAKVYIGNFKAPAAPAVPAEDASGRQSATSFLGVEELPF
jgi:hypothetical protein